MMFLVQLRVIKNIKAHYMVDAQSHQDAFDQVIANWVEIVGDAKMICGAKVAHISGIIEFPVGPCGNDRKIIEQGQEFIQ